MDMRIERRCSFAFSGPIFSHTFKEQSFIHSNSNAKILLKNHSFSNHGRKKNTTQTEVSHFPRFYFFAAQLHIIRPHNCDDDQCSRY